jgi:hypothetical protein
VIPTSGAINFLNFSGAIAFPADPIQPSVTQTFWHGLPSWTPGNVPVEQTRTGDVYIRGVSATSILALDGSGTKIYSNTAFSVLGRRWSWKNPNRTWIFTHNGTDRVIIQKASNTGVMISAANLAWNSVTGNTPYMWDLAVTSGSANTNTSYFPILTSNTNSTNATTSIVKVNATDMTTIEWKKTVTTTVADATSNIKPGVIWTNHDESAVYIVGTKGTANAAFVVLNTSDGSTQQSWMTVTGITAFKKTLGSNNIAFQSSAGIFVKSNTGSNVTGVTYATGFGHSTWLENRLGDVDYDGNIYLLGARDRGSNTGVANVLISKYNSSATRQWQVQVGSLSSANSVAVLSIDASNTRVALSLLEFTQAHDGKSWYVSGYGERRILYLSAASGNTGTFGRFVFATNTTTAHAATTNTGVWSYTFSPRSTTEASFNTFTPQTVTANNITFTKTAI